MEQICHCQIAQSCSLPISPNSWKHSTAIDASSESQLEGNFFHEMNHYELIINVNEIIIATMMTNPIFSQKLRVIALLISLEHIVQ